MTPSKRSRIKPRSSVESATTGRDGLVIERWVTIALLLGLSAAVQSVIYAPIAIWPLAYVCLVPWVVVIGACSRPRRVYVGSYLFGLAFFLANLKWIWPVTPEGYVALCVYLSAYFPLAACPIRHAVRRRRIPMVLAVPVIWVGSEFLRAVVMTGFPWFLLAHSQYRFLTMIQVSDLTGAYGVSFVVAIVNGAVADAVFAWGRARRQGDRALQRRRVLWSAGVAGVIVLLVLLYGQIQLRRNTTSPGPRIAVIQADYPLHTTGEGASYVDKARRHLGLLEEAAEASDADLYLLPETPWLMFLNREFLSLDEDAHPWVSWSRDCLRWLQAFANQHDAYVVTGAMSKELTPLNLWAEEWNFNSAYVIHPDGAPPDRYDKVHLVPFGERVPFRFGPFRFLYLWFNSLSPFAEDGEYTLTPGKKFRVFEMRARSLGGKRFRFGAPICYEDVMPYVSRRFVIGPDGNKRVDFLLNISNDGWFLHSYELPQHLAICAFRAVENRVCIARAVNTGISGFIDANGRIHDRVRDAVGRSFGEGIEGFAAASIQVDTRCSVYSRAGDWFAVVCCVLWGLAFVDYVFVRVRGGRAE